jgi:hypothetical protein
MSKETTTGKPIKCQAMVARAAKQALVEETITVDPPEAGEVRVRVMANALCHTGTCVGVTHLSMNGTDRVFVLRLYSELSHDNDIIVVTQQIFTHWTV